MSPDTGPTLATKQSVATTCMALQGALSCPVRHDLDLPGAAPPRCAVSSLTARGVVPVLRAWCARARQCDAGARWQTGSLGDPGASYVRIAWFEHSALYGPIWEV